jgi:hypothetical protein
MRDGRDGPRNEYFFGSEPLYTRSHPRTRCAQTPQPR